MGVIHHHKGKNGAWDWEGIPVQDYGDELPGVTVRRFISRKDGSSKIEMRYFELKPGANSNLETHQFLAGDKEAFGFLCTIIDKGLHESVYGNKKPSKQVC